MVVGHFIDDNLHRSEDVEIKWGIHPNGNSDASGRETNMEPPCRYSSPAGFRINLSTAGYVFEREGDYAIWGPGVGHCRKPRKTPS
jgi:hypothetical protein